MHDKQNILYGLKYHEVSKTYEEILVKTKYNPADGILYKDYPNSKSIKLEKTNVESELYNILSSRKSIREFDDSELTFDKLSKLLKLSASINKKHQRNLKLRVYPSAGGLFPLEIYVISLKSDKLSQGIYHYNVLEDSLELIKSGNFKDEMYRITTYQDFILNSSCIIAISAVFERTMKKYGERGYRYILLEAGHLGQNIYLVSTYLGLGTVAIGGFLDNEYNNIIGLEHKDESIIYSFAIGNPI